MDKRKQFYSILASFLIAAFLFAGAFADSQSAKVRSMGIKVQNGKVELAILADKPVQYRSIRVTDPAQALVFEVYPAVLWGKKETRPVNQGEVRDARIAQFSSNPDVVRVVLDLNHQVNFTANPSEDHHQLLIAIEAGSENVGVHPAKSGGTQPVPASAPVWKHVKVERKVIGQEAPSRFSAGLKVSPKDKPVAASETLESKLRELFAAKNAAKKKAWTKKKAQAGGTEYVTMHWRGADLTDVIRQLADKMNLNVIVDTAVGGKVTMDLKKVPAPQALGMILALNGYGYRQVGNVLVVAPPEKLDKLPTAAVAFGPEAVQVIPLENAKAGDLIPTVSAEYPGVKLNVDTRMNALIVKGSVSAIKQVKSLVSELDKPIVTPPPVPPQKAVVQLNYTNVKDVMTQIKPLLPADTVLIADDRLNSLIVIGSSFDIDTVKSFVSAVDVPSPQVMLEMQVISVNVNNSSDLGLEWPGGATTTFTEVPSGRLPGEGGSPPPADTGNGGGSVLNNIGFHTFVRDNLQLITRLHWLVQNNKAKVLGAPRVATVNDKQATIQLGQRIPIVYFDPRAGLYQVQYIDVGVILNVTPHISPDGYITVHVNPTVSEVTGFVQNFPQLETRQADTNVRVKNGQTIVLGGLLNEANTEAISKIPLLGDIPIIGELFKHTIKTHQKTDLVVSITPTVLNEK